MKTLRSCVLPQVAMPHSTIAAIEGHFRIQHFPKGQFILRSGQACRYLYFIKEGYLRLYSYADDQEITLWIGGEGQFITALSSFVFQADNPWNIQAETDVEVAAIHRDDHFALGKKHPEWLEFDNMLLARAYDLLEQNMFAQLHSTARERFDTLMTTNPAMFNHVPLQHIASMLRMAPETLSRLRNPARETS